MVTIFHHHLSLAIGLPGTTVVFHLANGAPDKANEKYKSNNDKEPGDKSKEFAGHIFPEFCKQQGTCKNS